MRKIHLKRGIDLRLQGAVEAGASPRPVAPERVAVCPDDFPGFLPKASVKEGDAVKAGTPLLHDKRWPQLCLTSPAAGVVEGVVRGERRHIERVVVKVDQRAPLAQDAEVTAPAPGAEAPRLALQRSGLWALLRQRPYDIVPPADTPAPRDIFITAFDSAPLAPSLMAGADMRALEAGVKALAGLTAGRVYVGTMPGGPTAIPGAEVVEFTGPHPSGIAGVQAANIAPVNKGERIWTLDVTTACRIGVLVTEGRLDTMARVAVCGPRVKAPALVETLCGAWLEPLLKGNLDDADSRHLRIISGNVLTGIATGADGYLRYPYRQVTVMAEGDDADEFMGWASPGLDKLSQSPTFLSRLLPGKRFAPDARLHGGRRAMILSGQYDKAIPMDIMPEYLIKAILARDIDRMEQLGIYEVAPEDFAAAEYADASKLELQRIVREGLDYMRKELE